MNGASFRGCAIASDPAGLSWHEVCLAHAASDSRHKGQILPFRRGLKHAGHQVQAIGAAFVCCAPIGQWSTFATGRKRFHGGMPRAEIDVCFRRPQSFRRRQDHLLSLPFRALSRHGLLVEYLPLRLSSAISGGYYLTPKNWRSLTIVIGSWLFYAWWRVDFLLLYAGVTLWSYWIGQRIGIAEQAAGGLSPRRWVQIGVTGSLAGSRLFQVLQLLRPEIAALLVSSRRITGCSSRSSCRSASRSSCSSRSATWSMSTGMDAPPARNFIDFAAFLALYPHLIAGPVMKYKDLAAQIVVTQPHNREILRRHGHFHDRLLQESADRRQCRPARR